MSIEKTKIKMIKNLEKENNYLLHICNKIEINLNYLNNYEYLNNNLEDNNIIYLENIKNLNENYFSIKEQYKINDIEQNIKDFSILYSFLNKRNEYLKDIIKFYKKFVQNDILLKILIDNLMLNTEISDITKFYYKLY